jgi:hypothetical protein
VTVIGSGLLMASRSLSLRGGAAGSRAKSDCPPLEAAPLPAVVSLYVRELDGPPVEIRVNSTDMQVRAAPSLVRRTLTRFNGPRVHPHAVPQCYRRRPKAHQLPAPSVQ